MNLHNTRVLMLTERWYPDTFGGSERLAWEQANGLIAQGAQVTVFSTWNRPSLAPEEVLSNGLRIVRAGLASDVPGGAMLSILRASRKRLRALLATETFDVVICQHPLVGSVYLELTAQLGLTPLPMLAVFHSSRPQEIRAEGPTRHYPGNRLWTEWVARTTEARERAVLHAAVRIVYFSAFSGSIITNTYPEFATKAVHIPAGIQTTPYTAVTHEGSSAATTTPTATRPLQLFTVRRLTPRMGMHILLDALALLRERGIAVSLRIAGDGHSRETLEMQMHELKLENTVTFLGTVSDAQLTAEFAKADAFVLPTTALEGFGIATLEALLAGVPVLGTPIGATPELLEPISPNLITTAATPEALADTIAWYANLSQEQRNDMSMRGRVYAAEHYSADAMNTALCTQIHAVLEHASTNT